MYGLFKKGDGSLSYLQMELSEQSTKKLSLLGKRKAVDDEEVVPIKQSDLECSYSCNNYTPNASAFTFNDDLY